MEESRDVSGVCVFICVVMVHDLTSYLINADFSVLVPLAQRVKCREDGDCCKLMDRGEEQREGKRRE